MREVREALADFDGNLPVVLAVDHALAGHVPDDTGHVPDRPSCDDFDVVVVAPLTGIDRTEDLQAVEVRVAWEDAG